MSIGLGPKVTGQSPQDLRHETLNLGLFDADPIPAGPALPVRQAMTRLGSPMTSRFLPSASICAICGRCPSWRRPAMGAFDGG